MCVCVCCQDPSLGGVGCAECLPERFAQSLEVGNKGLEEMYVSSI